MNFVYFQMNKPRRKSSKIFNSTSFLGGESTSNWIENYQKICCGITKLEDDFHLDILKDLWQEQIDDQIAIHLLAILDQFAYKLDDPDK